MKETWSLKSLTIGPLSHKLNRTLWGDVLRDFPLVPRLKELTVVYYFPSDEALESTCWDPFDNLFGRGDVFPRYMRVDIRITVQSEPLSYLQRRTVYFMLPSSSKYRPITFWGLCECSFLVCVIALTHPPPKTIGNEGMLCSRIRPFAGRNI